MTHSTGAADDARPPTIRITVIIQNRYTLQAGTVTATQIKEMASIPAGFTLHRRAKEGKETIGDGESVELHNGDHFFAQPPTQAGAGHKEEL
ncbi:MAG: hypothetical protein M3406_10715 [Chloroflexota bacterium]|nr:hypothetical protein [Chloroflexota bacterium]